jgi:hypothetical protein
MMSEVVAVVVDNGMRSYKEQSDTLEVFWKCVEISIYLDKRERTRSVF